MVQDHLVEYVSTQIKLGISRDAIKTALTGVGWSAPDVEDTLKKVEGGSAPTAVQPAAAQKAVEPSSPAPAAASPKFVSFSAQGTVVGQAKNPDPQTVRVSDLVSGIAPASSMPAGTVARTVPAAAAQSASALRWRRESARSSDGIRLSWS